MVLPLASAFTGVPTKTFVMETPAASFTAPAGSTATALTPSYASPTLTVAIGAGGSSIPQATTGVALKVTNVRTPSSIVATLTGTNLKSKDGVGVTDEFATVTTDPITAGDLGSATKSFVSNTKTPGFLDFHTLNIKTAGHIEANGKIVLNFPDLTAGTQTGWNFETPVVSFTSPTGPGGSAVFAGSARFPRA